MPAGVTLRYSFVSFFEQRAIKARLMLSYLKMRRSVDGTVPMTLKV